MVENMINRTVTLVEERIIKMPRSVHPSVNMATLDANKPWDPDEPYTFVLKLRSEAETEQEARKNLADAEHTIRQAFQ